MRVLAMVRLWVGSFIIFFYAIGKSYGVDLTEGPSRFESPRYFSDISSVVSDITFDELNPSCDITYVDCDTSKQTEDSKVSLPPPFAISYESFTDYSLPYITSEHSDGVQLHIPFLRQNSVDDGLESIGMESDKERQSFTPTEEEHYSCCSSFINKYLK